MSQPVNAKVEVVGRLCDDLSKDIKNMSDKGWLIPALCSHVAHLLDMPDIETERFVRAWFTKNSKSGKLARKR